MKANKGSSSKQTGPLPVMDDNGEIYLLKNLEEETTPVNFVDLFQKPIQRYNKPYVEDDTREPDSYSQATSQAPSEKRGLLPGALKRKDSEYSKSGHVRFEGPDQDETSLSVNSPTPFPLPTLPTWAIDREDPELSPVQPPDQEGPYEGNPDDKERPRSPVERNSRELLQSKNIFLGDRLMDSPLSVSRRLLHLEGPGKRAQEDAYRKALRMERSLQDRKPRIAGNADTSSYRERELQSAQSSQSASRDDGTEFPDPQYASYDPHILASRLSMLEKRLAEAEHPPYLQRRKSQPSLSRKSSRSSDASLKHNKSKRKLPARADDDASSTTALDDRIETRFLWRRPRRWQYSSDQSDYYSVSDDEDPDSDRCRRSPLSMPRLSRTRRRQSSWSDRYSSESESDQKSDRGYRRQDLSDRCGDVYREQRYQPFMHRHYNNQFQPYHNPWQYPVYDCYRQPVYYGTYGPQYPNATVYSGANISSSTGYQQPQYLPQIQPPTGPELTNQAEIVPARPVNWQPSFTTQDPDAHHNVQTSHEPTAMEPSVFGPPRHRKTQPLALEYTPNTLPSRNISSISLPQTGLKNNERRSKPPGYPKIHALPTVPVQINNHCIVDLPKEPVLNPSSHIPLFNLSEFMSEQGGTPILEGDIIIDELQSTMELLSTTEKGSTNGSGVSLESDTLQHKIMNITDARRVSDKEDRSYKIQLTFKESKDKSRAGLNPIFRWVVLESYSFEKFKSDVSKIPLLDEEERQALDAFLSHIRKTYLRTKTNYSGKSVPHMDPGSVSSWEIDCVQHLPSVEKLDPEKQIRWICFPYLSYEPYTGLKEANPDKGTEDGMFPITTLLQDRFSRTQKARDLQQAVVNSPNEDSCYHIRQIWSLTLGSKLLITCGLPRDHLENKIDLFDLRTPAAAPSRAPGCGILIVQFSATLKWIFNYQECNTWAIFLSHFQDLYPHDVEFKHNGKPITENNWYTVANLIRDEPYTQILQIHISLGQSHAPCGVLVSLEQELDDFNVTTTEKSNLQVNTSLDLVNTVSRPTSFLQGSDDGLMVEEYIERPQQSVRALPLDVSRCFHMLAWLSGSGKFIDMAKISRLLAKYESFLRCSLGLADYKRYAEVPENSSIRTIYNSLREEISVSSSFSASSDETVQPHNLEERIYIFNFIIIVFRFFLPLNATGPTISKFWSMVHRLMGLSQRSERGLKLLTNAGVCFRNLAMKVTNAAKYLDVKTDEQKLKFTSDFGSAYLHILTALTFVYADHRLINGFMEHMQLATDLVTRLTAMAMRSTKGMTLGERAVVQPDSILLALFHHFSDGPVLENRKPAEIYWDHTKWLENVIVQKSRYQSLSNLDRGYSVKLQLAIEELNALQNLLDYQGNILDKYNRVAVEVAKSERRDALQKWDHIIEPSRLDKKYWSMAIHVLYAQLDDISNIRKQCEDLFDAIDRHVGVTKSHQEQALFILTFSTALFLPMGTISSIYGVDSPNLWSYWRVAIIVTIVYMLFCLWSVGILPSLVNRLIARWREGKVQKVLQSTEYARAISEIPDLDRRETGFGRRKMNTQIVTV